MTGQELINFILEHSLQQFEFVVEVRVKTGYDEGHVYEQSIERLRLNRAGKVEIQLGTCKQVGAW